MGLVKKVSGFVWNDFCNFNRGHLHIDVKMILPYVKCKFDSYIEKQREFTSFMNGDDKGLYKFD